MAMYSLYRAWLSLGTCGSIPSISSTLPSSIPTTPLNLSVPPNQVTGAPDVTLQVGPGVVQFAAHKAILSAYSGFFKAALINHIDSTPISVPNVNADEFSSLLTFMYTGYLDLHMGNIYNILLATHILHMPRALEMCRSFLLHNQPPGNRINIIKPIPSRKTILPSQEIYPPSFGCLKKSEDTPFKVVSNEKKDDQRASTSKMESDPQILPDPRPIERKIRQQEKCKNNRLESSTDGKVIIDIASCDGPVKFHRVINKNYGLQPTVDTVPHEVNRNAALNKVMNENIRDKLSDENKHNNEVFTCFYCNHTFKSQYCYQKHARRHLNPVNLETKAVLKETKREVRLLDMNVQYYPCKTCGSKFPSYYFVHKHRKMCHGAEMADNNNKNNEIVMEIEENTTESSSSAIDVEAIQSDK